MTAIIFRSISRCTDLFTSQKRLFSSSFPLFPCPWWWWNLLTILSAYSVDHISLIEKLCCFYGSSCSVLDWLHSFIYDRSVLFCFRSVIPLSMNCGVPQGSVLTTFGTLLFYLCVSDTINVVKDIQLSIHFFADDIQNYGSCIQSGSSKLASQLSVCLDHVISCRNSHCLILSEDKCEFLRCFSRPRMNSLSKDFIWIDFFFVGLCLCQLFWCSYELSPLIWCLPQRIFLLLYSSTDLLHQNIAWSSPAFCTDWYKQAPTSMPLICS